MTARGQVDLNLNRYIQSDHMLASRSKSKIHSMAQQQPQPQQQSVLRLSQRYMLHTLLPKTNAASRVKPEHRKHHHRHHSSHGSDDDLKAYSQSQSHSYLHQHGESELLNQVTLPASEGISLSLEVSHPSTEVAAPSLAEVSLTRAEVSSPVDENQTANKDCGPINVPTVLIIRGNPGRGKSTLTNHLGTSLSEVKIVGGDGLYVSISKCNHRHILSHVENEIRAGNAELFDKVVNKAVSIVRHNMDKHHIIMEGYVFNKVWERIADKLQSTCLVISMEKTGLDTLQYADTVYYFNRSKNLDEVYNPAYLKKLIYTIQKKHISENKLNKTVALSHDGTCQRVETGGCSAVATDRVLATLSHDPLSV